MLKLIFSLLIVIFCGCTNKPAGVNEDLFPKEITEFSMYANNPVFNAGADTAWDRKIRERGFILYDEGKYKMWYTGFRGDSDSVTKILGYATSVDGIKWERYAANPIFSEKWTEDMFVVKADGKYHMYAEGTKDVAHYLLSDDGINWKEQGDLVIVKTNGDTIPGPYGTPSVWVEKGKWYLFYERSDAGVWVATSTDHKNWKNLSDEPVLKPGPEKFDLGAVASNQVIKFRDHYYMFYHANADPMWASGSGPWSSNVAVSDDLLHWKKYAGNPIVQGDHSSPISVSAPGELRLYTMHPEVYFYEPAK